VRVVMFYHSLVSDWNHGNAHFLRGVCGALQRRNHAVTVYEPRDGWSRSNLVADHGEAALAGFARAYPTLQSTPYSADLDLGAALDDADLVLVHEWNDPDLVRRIGEQRLAGGRFHLLFHDTHHRSVSDAGGIAAFDLSGYDGVLAFGASIRNRYLDRGWARRVWVWHEAADVTRFRPGETSVAKEVDLVWIGNWGDGEREVEIQEFLIEPVRALGLSARVHGVRYPESVQAELVAAGITYAGWLPNFDVPDVFSRARVTVHIPRGPYTRALPGIPTIRVFEAMACGVPLISAPWKDVEGLFHADRDYLLAEDGAAMRRHLRALLDDPVSARALAQRGLATIRARHTCDHRVDELLGIVDSLTHGDRRAGAAG
jgi:spore maturation protein CgeB